MYFPKPCWHGKKLFVRTSMGGSVSPNPPLLSKVIWEVDSWNGGDLDLESKILASRRLSKKKKTQCSHSRPCFVVDENKVSQQPLLPCQLFMVPSISNDDVAAVHDLYQIVIKALMAASAICPSVNSSEYFDWVVNLEFTDGLNDRGETTVDCYVG